MGPIKVLLQSGLAAAALNSASAAKAEDPIEEGIDPFPEMEQVAEDPALNFIEYTVRSGDSWASILDHYAISYQAILDIDRAIRDLDLGRQLRPGDVIRIGLDTHETPDSPSHIKEIQWDVDIARRAVVQITETEEVTAEVQDIALEYDRFVVQATIQGSLYQSLIEQGVPDGIIHELTRLYGWDIDFQRDIHDGNQVELMYDCPVDEEGNPLQEPSYCNILYAKLTAGYGRNEEDFPIYFYDGDYFDEVGRGNEKGFLTSIVNGARLSSGFGRRFHPVLGYSRNHNGVDFAAPPGTPIMAAASGRIIHSGRDSNRSANGIFVRIDHPEIAGREFETVYLHMSRTAVRNGARVEQGDVIGYIGTTGRSTGPHVHYEVQETTGGNRRPINPSQLPRTSNRTLRGDEVGAFADERDRLQDEFNYRLQYGIAPLSGMRSPEEIFQEQMAIAACHFRPLPFHLAPYAENGVISTRCTRLLEP